MSLPSRVFVTGGAGYIGGHVISRLLRKGVQVYAGIRSSRVDNAAFLKELPGSENLCIIPTPETEEENLQRTLTKIFQDRKVDALVHCASPVILSPSTIDDLVMPAVRLTSTVLGAMAAASPGKKPICVVTSSTSALYDIPPLENKEYSAKTWPSEDSLLDKNAYYALSKVRAEKEAWKIAQDKGLRLRVINPSLVLGPVLTEGHKERKLSDSVLALARLAMEAKASISEEDRQKLPPIMPSMNVVDVREVAKAHVNALLEQVPDGRYALVGERLTILEVRDRLLSALDELGLPIDGVLSEESLTVNRVKPIVDTSPSKVKLGIKYRSAYDTIRDTVQSIRKLIESRRLCLSV